MSATDIIGDPKAFFALQLGRLNDLDIDVSGCSLSHLCFRTETYAEYLQVRDALELHCSSNIENVWNGRPMSILQLRDPIDLGAGFELHVIELIPPIHRRVYKMGLEHAGIVVGESVDAFAIKHRRALTGQQFQSPECEPYYVTFFEDFTMVKFYKAPLLEICESQHGRRYEGFSHVNDWKPVD